MGEPDGIRHRGTYIAPLAIEGEGIGVCVLHKSLHRPIIGSYGSRTRMQVSEISGGVTNCLWKLTPRLESGMAPVVVRIFGEGSDLLINRAREDEVLPQLNQASFGAPVSSYLTLSSAHCISLRCCSAWHCRLAAQCLRSVCRLQAAFHCMPQRRPLLVTSCLRKQRNIADHQHLYMAGWRVLVYALQATLPHMPHRKTLSLTACLRDQRITVLPHRSTLSSGSLFVNPESQFQNSNKSYTSMCV